MNDERRDDDPREGRRDEVPDHHGRGGEPQDDAVTTFEEVSLRQGPHAGVVGAAEEPGDVADEATRDRIPDYDPRFQRVDPQLDTPRLRPARLGELDGFGLLTVVHGSEGAVVESDGTWRADAGVHHGDAVREALPVGTETTFAGTRIEGRRVDREEEVRVPVVVRGHGSYHDDEGRPLILVNFVLAEEG